MKKTFLLCLMLISLTALSACSGNSVSDSKADDEVVATGSVSESANMDESGQLLAATDTGDTPVATTTTLSDGLSVTSPSNSGNYTSGYNWNVIRGTADSQTVAIEVNGYRLHKYVAGSTTWNYIAATSMQTLKEGNNEYVIKAFDADDNVIDQISYHIDYQEGYALPNVGTNLNFILLISFVFSFGLFIRRKRV